MKRLLSFFIVLLLMASVYSCRSRKTVTRIPGTVVEISDSILRSPVYDTFRLGKLKHGEQVIKEFSLRNAGGIPVVISDIDSDCGCIVTRYDKRPVMPEELLPLSVSFDSRGYRGYVIKKVEILTTLDTKPLVIFIETEVE